MFALYASYLVYVYFFTDYYPSESAAMLYQAVVALLVAWFIVAENRSCRHVYQPFELGLFILLFWPIYAPYYFVKSRGSRGFVALAMLLAVIFVEWFVSLFWYALAE